MQASPLLCAAPVLSHSRVVVMGALVESTDLVQLNEVGACCFGRVSQEGKRREEIEEVQYVNIAILLLMLKMCSGFN